MANSYYTREGHVIWWSCILFVLACCLPCIDCGPDIQRGEGPAFPDFGKGWNYGWMILLAGYEGGNHGVPWSANVFLAIGLFCLWQRRHRLAGTLGAIATVLGLSTWFLNYFSRPYHYDVMVGYYFWQASHVVLFVGAFRAGRVASSMPRVDRAEEMQVEAKPVLQDLNVQ
jgi:hypothetical protein